jgi:hypothetical protein
MEESGYFSSNTKGQGYLADKIFKNTPYLCAPIEVEVEVHVSSCGNLKSQG